MPVSSYWIWKALFDRSCADGGSCAGRHHQQPEQYPHNRTSMDRPLRIDRTSRHPRTVCAERPMPQSFLCSIIRGVSVYTAQVVRTVAAAIRAALRYMDSSPMRRLAALLVMAFALPAPAAAQEDERARRVFDIFKTNCLECHGESRKGGSTCARTRRSSKAGRAAASSCPHDPDKSRLFLLVSHADPDDVMPLKRPKLPDEDIETIRQWIEDGGSLEAVEDAVPEEQRTSAARAVLEKRPIRPQERQYWAFQKPQRVRRSRRSRRCRRTRPRAPRNPIDAFLLAAMGAKGLTPAPAADRAHADPPRLSRCARPAAVAGRSRGVRQRSLTGRMAEARRSAARLAALRRALGAALARSGPLRRLRRLRVRRRPARSLALSRLRRQGVQRRQAVRRSSSASRSPATSTRR